MHKNLVAVQGKLVEHVREGLKILEVEDQKYLLLPALAVAEKPLSEQELEDRTHLSAQEIRRSLDDFLGRGVVVEAGEAVYELNPEMDKVVARNIQAKIEALRKNNQSLVVECESLLESGRAEYDHYDILMSRYLGERMAKVKLITAVMTRRNLFLQLLNSTGPGCDEITKIAIE